MTRDYDQSKRFWPLNVMRMSWLWYVLTFLLYALPSHAQSYTPEHPKVQQMVNRAVIALHGEPSRPGGEYEAGSPLLVAYAVYKVTGDDQDPLVKRGLDVARRLVAGLNGSRHSEKIVYETPMAALLLASVDAMKYGAELKQIRDWLISAQKSHGGFGYLERPTGDTSQVQYAMLGFWTLQQVEISVPPETIESTIRYLKRTVDPTGGWGYQGVVSNGPPVAQEGVTKSLSTAGLGAMLIAGDILGFYGERKKVEDDNDGIPEAFKRVDLQKKERADRRQVTMSRGDTDGIVSAAIRYQNTHPNFTGSNWYFYWRYSQERYESFLEIYEGKQNKSPPWYNQGVDELADLQGDDGMWGDPKTRRDLTPKEVSTAFAILFLIRSTQKAIGHLDEGITVGGYGLPKEVSTVRVLGNKIVSDAEASVESLLEMLEAKGSDVEMSLVPEDLQLSKDPAQRKEQVSRLSRLITTPDYRARRIAAKLLGRSEDLKEAPTLIYALGDPDPLVPIIAEEGLRLLSRKLLSGKLTADPDDSQRHVAVEFWKKWYLGLYPDYIFLD
ncbi:MAG: hypothetical protein KDB03_00195 [Planctomycetales bacterium]|nr:hypothetical protein [Planctomycetales bacterium]